MKLSYYRIWIELENSLSLSLYVKQENEKRTMGEGKDSKEVESWGKGRIRIHVT